jgi:rhodanese-related sulfurtransferase
MNSRTSKLLVAIVVLLVVGSLVSLAYNLVAPHGVLSLAIRPAAAMAAPATSPPAIAPAGASGAAADTAAAPATHKARAKKHAVKPAARKVTAKPAPQGGVTTTTPATPVSGKPAGSTPAAATPQRPPAPRIIEPAEARILQLQKGAIIVDAREKSLFVLGHIPGALSLPEATFEKDFDRLEKQLPRDAKIMVYCESESCDQAETVSWALVNKGYKNILYFKKGWSAWETADYEQEKGPSR